jgi:HTH-type transcriptional regulator, sugar sensing transcriptional regulator
MNNIIEQLKFLGLNEKQAKIYLALVELGQGTGYQIAEVSKVKRPTVYVILDELRKKGLILKIPHAKKQLFIAKFPDELFADFEGKFRSAKRILPELLAKQNKEGRKVKILYYEGKDGVHESLDYKIDQLGNSEVLGFYAKKKGEDSPIPKAYFDYNKKLFDLGVKVRGLAPLHGSLDDFRKLDKRYGWNILPLDTKEFSSDVSLEVADSFVRIILHKDKQSVVVDSPDFSKTMREIFEMIWESKRK